jgi:lysophospholipase L1-like esterase
MPWKTIFTVLTFVAILFVPQVAPALKNHRSLDPHDIPEVWDMPLPKLGPFKNPGVVDEGVDAIRTERLNALAPKNLVDRQHELDHFYAALLHGGVTRVLHYGDSPTTADLITADARAMLQKQFGDAGTGFILIARPWAWYNHRGVDMDASSNWKIDVAGASDLKDGLHGLGGASFRGGEGAMARWTLKDGQHRSVEISYLMQPDGGTFAFDADGNEIGTVDTTGPEKTPGFSTFPLPAGSKKFTLRVTKGTVRLFGCDFRKAGPGVVYSSLGVNGASVTLLSRSMNPALWAEELHHYKPDLVVLAYGTNESGYPQFVTGTWASEVKTAVHRVQAALPGVSILLMSPMDRGEKDPSGNIVTIASMPQLVKIESQIANDMGLAFFNTFEAMGGEGTMARWYNAEPRMVGADFIHPLPGGAKIVGELLYSALRDGYNDYKLRQLKDAETKAEAVESSKAEPSDKIEPSKPVPSN